MRLAERVTLAFIAVTFAAVACDFGIDLRGLSDGGPDAQMDALLDVDLDGFVPPMPATQIAAGSAHSCAVRKDGSVTCWGAGADGRLGNGGYVDSSVPVLVQGLIDATQVTAGLNHTCAVRKNGTAVCWGNNVNGQLGDGSTSRSPTPVPVLMATDVVQISAGSAFTCAIRGDANVYCWGQSGEELGFPNAISQTLISLPVQGLAGAVEIECGTNHACARTTGGDVFCWGSNSQGQLGGADAGATSDFALHVALPGKAISVTAASTHSCAVLDTHETWCWGNNPSGQLGNGSVTSSPVPTKVMPAANDFAMVAAGSNHTCAAYSSGDVACWGSNVAGQLGTGDTMMSTIPAKSGVTGIAMVASGAFHTCALGRTGSISCWGHNGNGRIGTGTRVIAASPVAVGMLDDVVELAVGADHSCARRSEAGIACWGDNSSGQIGVSPSALAATSVPTASIAQGLSALVAGGSETCGLVDGGAFCWGSNTSGQLGSGNYTSNHNPLRFGNAMPFPTKAIAVGSLHACGVAIDASAALCSGSNGANQLGTGGMPATTSNPLEVVRTDGGLVGVSKLWAGTTNACGWTAASELLCWGLNTSGQAGNGNKQLPTAIATLAVAWSAGAPQSVGFGTSHACALRGDGKVACWGTGGAGQLGDGMGVDRVNPVLAATSSTATQIAVGSNHTCALLPSGSIECWGAGTVGQIGNGMTKNQPTPVAVPALVAIAIAAGGDDTCAVKSDRTVVCWGPNVDGQLGDGTPPILPTPSSVMGY